jgi:hypothetical protein
LRRDDEASDSSELEDEEIESEVSLFVVGCGV